MPVLFSSLLRDALGVRNRRDLTLAYEAAKEAVRHGTLTLEGHSLPTTFNSWLALLEREKPLKNDRDVVDFSFADDAALAGWLTQWRHRGSRRRTVSANAFELFCQLKDLEAAYGASMATEVSNGKKDDVLAALSDLQAAVALLLSSYDKVHGALRLPDRQLPREALQPRPARSRPTQPEQARAHAGKGSRRRQKANSTAKRSTSPSTSPSTSSSTSPRKTQRKRRGKATPNHKSGGRNEKQPSAGAAEPSPPATG